jgi:hypothetical protein
VRSPFAEPITGKITFPARFTALSPLLEARAEDTLASATTAVVLAGRESPVTVVVVKRRSHTLDLAATLTDLSSWLQADAEAIGPYVQGDRFAAFLIQGGMEYEGACTATPGSLRHEEFHSWWGRGVKPAGQADGWLGRGVERSPRQRRDVGVTREYRLRTESTRGGSAKSNARVPDAFPRWVSRLADDCHGRRGPGCFALGGGEHVKA